VAYNPDIKIFALVKTGVLSKYLAQEGYPIPKDNEMVIGWKEAKRDENIFTDIGDFIPDFFGINTYVGGVLKRTDTIVDDMHFLGESQFNSLQGEEKAYVLLNQEKMPKLFLVVFENETRGLVLSEGDINSHKITDYYPIILGSAEAEMMRKEKLFTNAGDKIEDFFDKKVLIVGVLKPTGSVLDMMHLIPISKDMLVSK
jgi:hypothetical protein